MPNMQIYQYPNKPVPGDSDLLLLSDESVPGHLVKNTTVAQMAAAIQNMIVSPGNVKYVMSNGGSDVTGNGSIEAPWATIGFAQSQITDASTSNVYLILPFGQFTETDLAFKPNIFWDLRNSQLTVTNQVILDPSWSAGGLFFFQNAFELNFPAGALFDFDALGAPFSVFSMNRINVAVASTFEFIGNASGTTIAILEGFQGFTNQPNLTVTNCYGSIYGGAAANVVITHTSETTGGFFSIRDGEDIGTTMVEDSTAAGMTFITTATVFIGAVTYRSTSVGQLSIISTGGIYLAGVILDGVNVIFNPDFIDVEPTLINGATFVPATIANGMNANYSPVNYIPTNPTVPGHLAGIDAALNASGSVLTQTFFVSPQGVDAPGRGTQAAPFLTPEYAQSQILAPSPSFPFSLYLTTGVYTTVNFALLPNVSISGDPDAFWTISGAFSLDASWASSPGAVCRISNIRIAAVNMGFDFNALSSFGVLFFDNVVFDGSGGDVDIDVTGVAATPAKAWFKNCWEIGNLNLTTTDVDVAADDAFFNNVTNISTSNTAGQSVLLKNCSLTQVTQSTSGSQSISVAIESCGLLNVPNLTNNISLKIDMTSFNGEPILTGGATYQISTGIRTFQELSTNDPTGDFTPPTSFSPKNTLGEKAINIDSQYTFHGYCDQVAMTADLTVSRVNQGVFLVSDNVANHNFSLISAAVDGYVNQQIGFVTGASQTITILVPSGVLLNGTDGSVQPSVVIPAGRTVAWLVRTALNSYSLGFWPNTASVTVPTLQQVYNASGGTPVIQTLANFLEIQDASGNPLTTWDINGFFSWKGGQKFLSLGGDITLDEFYAGRLFLSDDASAHTVFITTASIINQGVQTVIYSGATYPVTVQFDSAIVVNGVANCPTITIPPGNFGLVIIKIDANNFSVKSAIPVSGSYLPTFSGVANIGTFTLLTASYNAPNLIPRNRCSLTAVFTAVPTAISAVFGISIPVGANFTGVGAAQFVGGTAYDTGTQALFTQYRGADSAAGNFIRVAITVPVAAVNVSNTFHVSLEYEIQ